MTNTLIICNLAVAIIAALEFGVLLSDRKRDRDQKDAILRLWSLEKELRAENLVLTESLTRSEGRQFIRPPKELKKSPGWFDGKAEVQKVVGE